MVSSTSYSRLIASEHSSAIQHASPPQSQSHSHSHASASAPAPDSIPITTTVLVSGRHSTLEVDPYDVLAAALVPGALQSNDYTAERQRWYILFVFGYLNALQSMIWCTFSSVPEYSNEYFFSDKDSQHLLAFWLNWGCIIYLPAVFFAAWLLTHRQGLRICVILGASLCFLSSALRMLVTFFPASTRERYLTQFILLTHIAQITNAIVGPLVLASPSKLSSNWFPDSERATATAIGSNSAAAGVGFMYLLGPAIVQSVEDVNILLRVITIMSSVPLALALIHFPDRPKNFPSAQAAQSHQVFKLHESEQLSFVRGITLAVKSPSFLALILAASVSSGVYVGWYSTLPTVLIPLPYTQAQSGSFTSITRFSFIAGGLMSGRMADYKQLQRKLKPLLIVFLLFAVAAFTLFTFSVPSISYPTPPLPSDYMFVFCCVAGGGFFLGAASPLFYELGAELAHPAPESTAAGLMTLLTNVGGLIVLSIQPNIELTKINAMMTIAVSISLALCLIVKEQYLRHEAGDSYRAKNEGVAAVLSYYRDSAAPLFH